MFKLIEQQETEKNLTLAVMLANRATTFATLTLGDISLPGVNELNDFSDSLLATITNRLEQRLGEK